jgi:hypothetical protein
MRGQAITESFVSVATLTTSGWAQQNLSTPAGSAPNWVQGNSGAFAANSGAAAEYIAVTYNSVTGANTISNWLFAPNRTFSNGDVIKFYTRTAGGYADNLQLRLSTNGASVNAGATNVSVGDFTTLLLDINPTLVVANYPSTWTQYTVAISGLASPTSGRVAFRYFVTNGGPLGANSNYIGIDDFEYIPAGTPTSPNVTASKYGEYTSIPLVQVAPMPLLTTINNIGTGPTSDAKVTVNIFQGPNFVTPIQSYTSTPAAIAAGGTLAVNVGTYTPTTAGNYLFQFITSCTGNTITTADTAKYAFSVVNNQYARDNGTSVQGIGAGNTASAIIGNTFKINTTTYLDSVLFFVAPRSVGLGDTVRVRISSTTAGVPSNTGYIGQSASYTITAADTTSNGAVLILDVKDLSNNRLSLTPGTYFVGIEETKSGDNYNLQCSAEIFTQNTVFANLNNGAYSPLNSLLAGFNYVPIIRPYLNSCANTSITVTSGTVCAGQSFTMVPSGATTYTYSSGTSVVAPTASSSYTVTGDNNGCINTAVSSVAVNALPIVSVNSGAICVGQSFTMTPSGATTYTFSNGSDIVTPTANSNYTLTGTDANGCSNTAVSSLTVNTLPIVSVISATICSGATGTVVASGANTYTWNTGATTNSIVDNPSITTDYTVSGTSAEGCLGVAVTGAITVGAAPSIVVNSASICAGSSATLTANGVSTYTWNTGANTTSIIVTPTVNTVYSVNGDLVGCGVSASNAATVTINSLPIVSVNSGTICSGQSFTMTPSGATTYAYSNGSDVVTSSVNASYTVTGTDANGCENTAVSALSVNALPIISVNSGTICSGQSFTMIPSGATTYTFSNGSDVVTSSVNASYTVTGTDANGCENTAVSALSVNTLPIISVNSGTICAGQSFTMTPSGATTYTYSNGSDVVTSSVNASYTVTGTDANGCENTAVSALSVNALPVVTAVTNNTLLCVGQTATLSVSGAANYTWSTTDNTSTVAVSPTVQTTYTVNGTDANGCSNSTTITQDVSLCAGIATLTNSNAAINLYPNPNNGLFTIELTSTSKVTLTNALGQIVIAETFEVGKHSLDIHNEATGVYFVKVIENNNQHIIKVVKQ